MLLEDDMPACELGGPWHYLHHGMQVNVKSVCGKTTKLRVVPPDTSVFSIKVLLQRQEGIPISEQRLFFGSAELSGESMLGGTVGDAANVDLLFVRVAAENFLPRQLKRRR